MPREAMIPIMPFHTILKHNFCLILLFLGRSPNLHTKSKWLNMERIARGSAQMLTCSSSAAAASTSQLGGHSEGQTTTTSPSALLLTFRFLEETNCPGTTGILFRAANWCSRLLPSPIFFAGKCKILIFILYRPWCWLQQCLITFQKKGKMWQCG